MTITCGFQPTDAATMAMEVLHNSCNICPGTLDLTDIIFSPQPVALGLRIQAYISGKSLMPMLQLLHVSLHEQMKK